MKKLTRFIKLFFLHLQHLPMRATRCRPLLCKLGGVAILNWRKTFIGNNVVFDSNHPEDIIIHEGVIITDGCKIVTHFYNTDSGEFDRGTVEIHTGAYLGMNTIICKPVVIGKNAVVGAGSVVTKSIPDNDVWAGNPARFLRHRSHQANS